MIAYPTCKTNESLGKICDVLRNLYRDVRFFFENEFIYIFGFAAGIDRGRCSPTPDYFWFLTASWHRSLHIRVLVRKYESWWSLVGCTEYSSNGLFSSNAQKRSISTGWKEGVSHGGSGRGGRGRRSSWLLARVPLLCMLVIERSVCPNVAHTFFDAFC
jgi:hypothetical protein